MKNRFQPILVTLMLIMLVFSGIGANGASAAAFQDGDESVGDQDVDELLSP